MALNYERGKMKRSEATLAYGSYMAESAKLKDYIRHMLDQYESHLIPIEELRKRLGEALKDQSLSELVRQMREESEH